MKFYDLNTEFSFGKFEGKTVREILDLQSSYLDWCAINLDYFYITENVITKIKTIKPDFALTTEGQQKLDEKYANWESEQEDDYDYDVRDSYRDETNWSHYNDDLDMDQQSIEFWNQF